MSYIRMVTDDTLADEFRPIASAIMVEDATSSEYVSLDGTKTVAEVEWPIYRARLSDTGDLSVSFDASESYDPDAPEGEKGLELYEWTVFFDYPWDSDDPTLEGHVFQIPAAAGGDEWSYVFRNLKVGLKRPGGPKTSKAREGLLKHACRLQNLINARRSADRKSVV